MRGLLIDEALTITVEPLVYRKVLIREEIFILMIVSHQSVKVPQVLEATSKTEILSYSEKMEAIH